MDFNMESLKVLPFKGFPIVNIELRFIRGMKFARLAPFIKMLMIVAVKLFWTGFYSSISVAI